MSTDTVAAEVDQATPSPSDKIVCHIDGEEVHSIATHIKNNHEGSWTLDEYRSAYPEAPLLSEYAKMVLKRKRDERAKREAEAAQAPQAEAPLDRSSKALDVQSAPLKAAFSTFHETFDLGDVDAAKSASGNPIQVSIMSGHDQEAHAYLPEIDDQYVFNIDLLKKVVMGQELNFPVYLWGFHGTGKTTLLEQACARTKRPFVRIQHSLNMQESDVIGQWTVRDGSTVFQLGPLPMAMINGWTYCADEYDTAMPNVTTIYQPVLEGKALLIKDAPPAFRKITPHENFRFVATGNTNGIGDETGLYQGTLMQNAANYSRFKITEEVKYMDPDLEVSILQARTRLTKKHAAKIVKFGNEVRTMFGDGKISMTVSPRELITAAQLGHALGGNWIEGINLAFANRLSRVDQQVVGDYLQRVFGT